MAAAADETSNNFIHLPSASDKVVCSQCGAFAYPHQICRCRLCGIRHAKVPGCRALRQVSGVSGNSLSAIVTHPVSNHDKSLCAQCSVYTYPHDSCRCRTCGRRHAKVPGCRIQCDQCGLSAPPHRACRCQTCNVIHSRKRRCFITPALQHHSHDVMPCAQCGLETVPHTRCRCLSCGAVHLHTARCRRTHTSAVPSALIPIVHDAGAMDQVCAYCHSRSWRHESVNCCASGAITLNEFPEIPHDMSCAILSPHVRQNIRAYNMAMAMASVGHQNISLPDGMFVLGGKTFHRVGSLLPSDSTRHSFAQIYILDTEQATDRRLNALGRGNNNLSLQRDVLSQLHNVMLRYNPLVRQFVAAWSGNQPQLVWRCSDDISSMQIGALVVEPGSKRDIVIQRCDAVVQFINDGHALYHPLAYPLLFPLGSAGWHDNLKVYNSDYSEEKRVTLTEWGRYHLMHRDRVTHMQKCEKLAMEFQCDLWAQVEARNAHFHRSPSQQAKYRGARVAAIEDQLSSGCAAADIGKPVIRLPSSFVGSARYYQQLYMDAMALPKKFGKPDMFITMTCNPHWPEIQNALPHGSHYRYHADIVERVFMLKLSALIHDIVKDSAFGAVVAYVYRIEWQARGLPHAHMLFILKDKILSERHIDAIVSAEIPDPITAPILHELVLVHMLHPRCDVSTHYGCRRDGQGMECPCSRHFPKQMSRSTVVVPDGYPVYKRRGRFRAELRNGTFASDDWVVPYNSYLLQRYRCHINVEVCAHFRCFKYVYKYTFKPPDHTAVCVDEIEAHLSGRLLTVSEAVHRLLSLPLHDEWPSVVRLDIHLPRQQQMIFDPTADESTLLDQLTSSTSTLMGWFCLNAEDEYARTLLYHDIPSHYTWKQSCWHKRIYKKIQPVGRIYGVSHHNSELFALRRLLSVVKGPTCFEDIATVEGIIHESFRAACIARGMLADDTDLIAAMNEIIEVTVSVDAIRRYFARILIHNSPADPQALFNIFVDDLCTPQDGDDGVNNALQAIESEMNDMGRSLTEAEFGFSNIPDTMILQRNNSNRSNENQESNLAEAQQQVQNLLPLFSDEQLDALNQVMLAVESDQEIKLFALLCSAGCGKTVFANGLAAYMRCQSRKVKCVAASALAAMLLSGGSTAHSAFHIPIPANETTMCNLTMAQRLELRKIDMIIYDECSMVHRDVADTLERTLRDVMKNARPFGGKAIIFMGDFKQLLPVVRFGRGHSHTIQHCNWWHHLQFLHFSKNWRAASDPAYTQFLEEVGNGRIDYIAVPEESRVHSFTELIDAVYGNTFDNNHQILALTLETCTAVNKLCFDKLPGKETQIPAADSYIDCNDPDNFPHDYIESLDMKGAPPWMLQFKIGAKYMCIRNLDSKRGIINGTMLKLIHFGKRYAQFEVLTGKSTGICEIFTKAMFTITPDASGLPFTILRRQYPIIPAYCLSVHKAQGQTLNRVGLIFESDPFTHGQLYVALSRVSGWSRVFAFYQGDNIKNCVLKHLL